MNKVHLRRSWQKEPWELMNWIKKQKLPAIEVIKYNRWPYLEIDNLWQVSQIRYSLVVILELNDVSEVQYKDVMMIDDGKYQ